MGMSTKRGGRSNLSEINVTPLVDVMLVLLIIFMVTAPMAKTGVQVELPKTVKADSIETAKPIDVMINSKNQIYIGKKKISFKDLADYVGKKKKSARIEADKNARYGTVAKVMAKIKSLGIESIALVTEEAQ